MTHLQFLNGTITFTNQHSEPKINNLVLPFGIWNAAGFCYGIRNIHVFLLCVKVTLVYKVRTIRGHYERHIGSSR